MSPLPSPDVNGSPARDQALEWFVRRRDQGLDAQEEQRFQAWLAADPANGKAFESWQAEWAGFDAIPAEMTALLQRNLAYDQAMAAASAAGRARAAAPAHNPARRRILAPALAAAVVAVTGGAGFLAWQATPTYTQSLASQRGQQREAMLPDGTRLRLDTATRVEVRYYRQRREVRLLEGQALFTVSANPEQPFDVLAGHTRVTVVGTRFSVRYTPEIAGQDGVRVAVEEGRVRVARADAQDAVMLSTGQQVVSDGAGVPGTVRPVAAADVAPWRNQRVIFDGMRLDQALAELGRYRDVPLVIRDPAVAALRVTGVFDPLDITTFQQVLPSSLPVRLQASGAKDQEIVLR